MSNQDFAFLNKNAVHDGVLRVAFICQGKEFEKSDAFLLSFNGEYLLIDGGMRGATAAVEYLSALRRSLLCGADENDNADKVKLSILISHFHVDHIYATMTDIIPSPYLYVDKIYLPPDSDLAAEFGERGVDGDTAYRTDFAAAIAKHQPQAQVINIPFGKENISDFTMEGFGQGTDINADITGAQGKPSLRIYPPVADWSNGERLEYIINNYYKGDRNARMIATAVVNAGCIWLRVTYGEKVFLFTGDSLKKRAKSENESCDEMVGAYKDDIGKVTVLKFPHHGANRDNAAAAMLGFEPKYIVLTTVIATAEEAVNALRDTTSTDTNEPSEPKEKSKSDIKFVNSGYGTVVFETDGKKLECLENKEFR